MRVVIAFDKFKNSMSAGEACKVAEDCLRELHQSPELSSFPLSDGGEGFAEILTAKMGGELRRAEVTGPLFEKLQAHYGWVPVFDGATLEVDSNGPLAIIEMAQASGLESVPEQSRDPWKTTTRGTGELIKRAAEEGAGAILLGIGGSATNDCGFGALEVLGLRAYDRSLQPVELATPNRWKEINSLGSMVEMGKKIPPIRIACDVENPLTGERGASSVYGPQKGLRDEDLERMERAMDKMARRLLGLMGHPPDAFEARMREPGAGAAGGIGFGLRTCLRNVEFVNGFQTVARLTGLSKGIAGASVVLTGEGRFDRSSLEGKGPGGVLKLCPKGSRCVIFVGSVEASLGNVFSDQPQVELIPISPSDMPLSQALEQGPELLRRSIRDWISRLDS